LPLAGFSGLQMPGAPESLDYALVPNCYCYRCPVGQAREICNIECADSAIARIEALRPDRVAALIIEPIQGSVGHPPPVEWFKRLADYLKKHGILLIVDEVANGFARLGNNFAFEAFRIQPDVLTLSKAITNGALPMAATLTTAEVTNVLIEAGWTPSFGSTQDGNPVCAAAALATLDILEAEDWASRAQYLGKRLDKMLRREIGNHPNVGEIRGMGLFRAVELVQNRATRSAFKKTEALAKELKDRRLLVRCDGGIIIIAPPLSTPHEVIDEIAFRVGAALRSTSGS
ncbi:MAG: aminotransferase class III-fold pyridoxal phosphate-dependent enzyme, partial [Hyphomonadaceae bacterium]